jgi:hypothetical protein
LAESEAQGDQARTLLPSQAAAVTWRIAVGPPAGRKLYSPQGAMPREQPDFADQP